MIVHVSSVRVSRCTCAYSCVLVCGHHVCVCVCVYVMVSVMCVWIVSLCTCESVCVNVYVHEGVWARKSDM